MIHCISEYRNHLTYMEFSYQVPPSLATVHIVISCHLIISAVSKVSIGSKNVTMHIHFAFYLNNLYMIPFF